MRLLWNIKKSHYFSLHIYFGTVFLRQCMCVYERYIYIYIYIYIKIHIYIYIYIIHIKERYIYIYIYIYTNEIMQH